MKCFLLIAFGLLVVSFANAQAASPDMIFWEGQSWQSNGPSSRLTLWSDGRSEISFKRFGTLLSTEQLNPRWQMREEKPMTVFYQSNPLAPDEAKARFHAALEAGIADLKTFPPGYYDGSGTVVGIETDGQLKQTTIPMFLHEGEKDNKGSENEKRFLAVKAAFGTFQGNPTTVFLDTQHINYVAWEDILPGKTGSTHYSLYDNGNSNITVEKICNPRIHLLPNISASQTDGICSYSKINLLDKTLVQTRLQAITATGIAELITELPEESAGEHIVITVRDKNWTQKKFVFSPSPQLDGRDPKNYQRFLAVQKAFGSFDTNIEQAAP
jgi:hypothetical protein